MQFFLMFFLNAMHNIRWLSVPTKIRKEHLATFDVNAGDSADQIAYEIREVFLSITYN